MGHRHVFRYRHNCRTQVEVKFHIDNFNCKVICPITYDLQIVLDDSQVGWGGTLGEMMASGNWNCRVSRESSNYRELLAILLCLKTFAPHTRNRNVKVLTDISCALAYINNQGGPSKRLSWIA